VEKFPDWVKKGGKVFGRGAPPPPQLFRVLPPPPAPRG